MVGLDDRAQKGECRSHIDLWLCLSSLHHLSLETMCFFSSLFLGIGASAVLFKGRCLAMNQIWRSEL